MTKPPLLTRRQLTVAGAGLAAAAYVPNAWAGRLLDTEPKVGPGRFLDGVASGEPSPDAITLWSRMTTDRPRSGAELVVARDEGLTKTVARATVPTSRGVDGALKARVDGLEPDTVYWYAWRSSGETSPIGRTKTAKPADADQPLNVAYSSCQNWPTGFFNGHVDAAKLDPLDLYMFLGDYTYEYGPSTGVTPDRNDPSPSVDLQTYRDKLKLYRSDPGLRELHRLHPVAHVWDDHEVADNYSDNDPRPSNLQRAAGYQSSFEWLPRLPFEGERYRLHRSLKMGRQCELFVLDQRQYRTGDGDGKPRSLLGKAQLDWFLKSLEASTARWKIIANPLMFVPLGGGGQGVNTDQWDGYPDEQSAVRDLIASKGIKNVIFITGDIHTFFTCRVLRDGNSGPSIATEYVGGSITSGGFPSANGLTTVGVMAANPWITYTNGTDHGYTKLGLSAGKTTIEYRVAPINVPNATSRTLKRYEQPVDANDFTETGGSQENSKELGVAPAPRELLADRAATAALAKRRRAHEKLVRAAQERTEAQQRRTGRRRKGGRS